MRRNQIFDFNEIFAARVPVVFDLQLGVAVVLVNCKHLRRSLFKVVWVDCCLKQVFVEGPSTSFFLLLLFSSVHLVSNNLLNDKLSKWIELAEDLADHAIFGKFNVVFRFFLFEFVDLLERHLVSLLRKHLEV